MTEHRYPLEPLLRLTGWPMAEVRRIAPCGGEEYRRRSAEGVTALVADRLATTAGYHPCEVWPDYTVAAELPVRVCEAEDCTEVFLVTQAHRKYCSHTCSSRHRRQVRYRTEPSYRERKQLEARAYYLLHGDEVRERNREAKAAQRRRARKEAA